MLRLAHTALVFQFLPCSQGRVRTRNKSSKLKTNYVIAKEEKAKCPQGPVQAHLNLCSSSPRANAISCFRATHIKPQRRPVNTRNASYSGALVHSQSCANVKFSLDITLTSPPPSLCLPVGLKFPHAVVLVGTGDLLGASSLTLKHSYHRAAQQACQGPLGVNTLRR